MRSSMSATADGWPGLFQVASRRGFSDRIVQRLAVALEDCQSIRAWVSLANWNAWAVFSNSASMAGNPAAIIAAPVNSEGETSETHGELRRAFAVSILSRARLTYEHVGVCWTAENHSSRGGFQPIWVASAAAITVPPASTISIAA
jgi:hypothetical protein